MGTFCKLVGLLVLLVLVFGGPAALVSYKSDFLKDSAFFELLRTYLATTAIVGALWAVYLKDTRLRSGSEYVLVSLFFFVLTLAIAAVGAILLVIEVESVKPGAAYFGYLALVFYVMSLGLLVTAVFVRSYNEVYNLRTNKFYKYFKPVRRLRGWFASDKNYEFSFQERDYDVGKCVLMANLFGEPADRTDAEKERMPFEKDRIKQGASLLLTGTVTAAVIEKVVEWIIRRMEKNETASYVACDRHPYSIWEQLQAHGLENLHMGAPLSDNLVLIDVFTPAFGFTDDIHQERDRQLDSHGISFVKAKTFAGLHTAVNKAFNIIKHKDKEQKNKKVRRASVMVYDRTSALCDTESVEQFRVFWRHVIPSERSYGMITVIIEDTMAGDPVLKPLKELVASS
jgi:hypothetical protein